MHLPSARAGYDEPCVQACFGPWLAALVADLVLTLRLGRGYVAGLRQLVAAHGARATSAWASGKYLSSEPPPVLRMHVALAALTVLGQHAEATRQREALEAALGDTSRSYLPVDDGRYFVLGTEYLRGVTDEIVDTCLQLNDPKLGGAPLLQWPGLRQPAAAEREQAGLAESLATGKTPSHTDASRLLTAALLAWDAGHDPQRVLASLHRALAPTPPRAAARPIGPKKVASRRVNLLAAVRDPAGLRRAIVLGAALEPRRTGRQQSGSHGLR
jgi:hypothetical protein